MYKLTLWGAARSGTSEHSESVGLRQGGSADDFKNVTGTSSF